MLPRRTYSDIERNINAFPKLKKLSLHSKSVSDISKVCSNSIEMLSLFIQDLEVPPNFRCFKNLKYLQLHTNYKLSGLDYTKEITSLREVSIHNFY